jgi:DNA-binding transcriptional LysR family regulator
MELRQLSYFLAAAQTQNFRKAAQLCFVTQPALSRQMALLEKELGVALFKREKQQVRLTPAGQALTEYAKQAVELLQQGQQELVRWQQGQSGTVRIGCNPSLAAAVLPPLLASFRQQFPDIHLTVQVHRSKEVMALLEREVVDLGFLYDPAIHSEVVVIKELFRQPLHLLIPPHHPLAHCAFEELTLARIVSEPLIFLDEEAQLRKVLNRLFLQRGITVRPVIEIASVEALKELVKLGSGVTLIPPALLWRSQREDGLRCFPLADVTETFIFALAYRRIGLLNASAQRFLQTVQETTVTIVKQLSESW